MDEPRALRREIVSVAVETSRRVLAIYRSKDLALSRKGDGSPVTRADTLADRLIREALASRFPYPVLSEESPIPPFEERRSWTRFWLVDPLDGTRDFVARTGDFTVNIALVEGGRPVLGVIAAPCLGIVWSSARGEGAFRRVGERETPIRNQRSPCAPVVAVASRFHHSPELDRFLAEEQVDLTVHMGSAVKLGRIAEGQADIYARFGTTMVWDVAAGDSLVTEAGCSLVDAWTGSDLRYDREELEIRGFIVRSARRSGATELVKSPPGRGSP